jgi:hypothetical protein
MLSSFTPTAKIESTHSSIHQITFKAFAGLAHQRLWTVQHLAERFRGRIENPTEFFTRVIEGKFPAILIPYRSVIEFYQFAIVGPQALSARPVCACGCGRIVFDQKKWATPGCRTKVQRKKVRDRQFSLPEVVNFVEARVRQNRGIGPLPLTRRKSASEGL